MCGASLREAARRVQARPRAQRRGVAPPPTLPPNVQQTLSPAMLVHLFYDKHFDMEDSFEVGLAVAATLYTLEAEGYVALSYGKRGRIRKSETVEIRKLRSFDPRRFGYLSEKIHELRVGKSINVYDLVKKSGKRSESPTSLLMALVVENDLTRETWSFLYEEKVTKVKRSLIDKLIRIPGEYRWVEEREENIRLYEPQAIRLSQLVRRRMEVDPGMHRLIQRECARALSDLEYVPWEY